MSLFINYGDNPTPDKDIRYSTRYEDQELIKEGSYELKLDLLSRNLNNEISLCAGNVLKLERLQDRYVEDGVLARAQDEMGYFQRYVFAYERIKVLVEAHYLPYQPFKQKWKV